MLSRLLVVRIKNITESILTGRERNTVMVAKIAGREHDEPNTIDRPQMETTSLELDESRRWKCKLENYERKLVSSFVIEHNNIQINTSNAP